IVVTDTITLDGGGAPGLRISGGNARRVFAVSAGGSLTLQRLTITGGLAQGGTGGTGTAGNAVGGGGGGAGLGGAAFVAAGGMLHLTQSTVTGNLAQGGAGGAGVNIGTG